MNGDAPVTFDPWAVLGIERTTDRLTIRRAYARRLKSIDPETDAAAFIALREARDWAAALAEGDGSTPEIVTPVEAVPVERVDAVVPSLPRVDIATIERLRHLVLDTGLPPAPERVAAAARAVLDDEAMGNLEHAARVEDLFADLIVRGVPRGDALIDPALEHFRWRERFTDLDRPPVVQWILQRDQDRFFELELATEGGRYAKLLDRLRRPPRGGKAMAWVQGTRVEYLLATLQQQHPTVLAGLDGETVDWWWARIEEQRRAPQPIRWLRERWRRWSWMARGQAATNAARAFIFLGVVLKPYLFAWLLLRRGFTTSERVAGFGWLVVVLLGMTLPGGSRTDPVGGVPPVSAPANTLTDAEVDLRDALQVATAGTVTPAQVEARDPGIYRRLQRTWSAARTERLSLSTFRGQVMQLLDANLLAALHGDDARLILDHAGYYAARLRWAERVTPAKCLAVLDGTDRDEVMPDAFDARARLIGRALLAGPAPTRPAPAGFVVPTSILPNAIRRSLLGPAAFRAALRGKGTAGARCNAQIALLDAARAGRAADAVPMLRGYFSGEPARSRPPGRG